MDLLQEMTKLIKEWQVAAALHKQIGNNPAVAAYIVASEGLAELLERAEAEKNQ